MTIYAIFALINVATSIVLGLLVYLADRKSALNILFALFASSLAFWSYSYFSWQIQTDAASALWWTHLLMAGATFITPTYYHFCCRFLGIEKEQWPGIVAGYIFIAVSLCINWSPLYISGVISIASFPFWPVAGPLFTPFLIIWAGYAIFPVYLLLRSWRGATSDNALAIRFILAGTIIGYLGGFTNYFLWYGIEILPIGNISASVYIAFVAYAILRHRLFNMKVIATELLVFLLWLFVFVRLLLADTYTNQLIEGSLLLILLVVGTFLIRSVDHEVEQREEIQRLSDEKSEFMTFASHEIRNPITAMRGFASLIEDGTTGVVPKSTKDAAQKILVTGNEVLLLIAQFLSKSKLELGKIEYLIAPFDVAAAVSIIADGYMPHAKQKGLTLEKRIDAGKKILIKGDEGKLKEVVGNLIDNALKYTREGSITVTVWQDTKRARIVIEDTGVGIPAETLPQLFKKFSRADAQKVNLLGTGVGLFLAKTFIEGQGGTIRAESAGKDKGSRFIIEFPLA